MQTFEHVSDENTRKILTGVAVDEDGLCQALTHAEKCWVNDFGNEEVPESEAQTRFHHISEATWAWNQEGNADKAVYHLQKFWEA